MHTRGSNGFAGPVDQRQGQLDFSTLDFPESSPPRRAIEGLVSLLRPSGESLASLEECLSALGRETGSSHIDLLRTDENESGKLTILASWDEASGSDSPPPTDSPPDELRVMAQKAIDSDGPLVVSRECSAATSGQEDAVSSRLILPIVERPSGAPLGALHLEGASRHLSGYPNRLLDYSALLSVVLPRLQPSRDECSRELTPRRLERLPAIVGESEATQALKKQLRDFGGIADRPDPPPILVTGESGTGKDLVARYLHASSDRRSRGPFVAYNCAGLRGDLAESRLFGHAKGSFTGATAEAGGLFRAANRGTLFLDEFGEIPFESQAILLRAIETRCIQAVGDAKEAHVDVQVILATNRDLMADVKTRRFREDLYYRISALVVDLLPLRHPQRVADLRPLLAAGLARSERELGRQTFGLTPPAFRALCRYAWPGNVRQLNNVCLNLIARARAESRIDVADIRCCQPEILNGPTNPNPDAYLEDGTYAEAHQAFRDQLIQKRLTRFEGNAHAAAASLEISDPTFYRYWKDARNRAADSPCGSTGVDQESRSVFEPHIDDG